jgi:hypothetical protein
MRLSGWQRIGIVVSFLWWFIIIGLAIYHMYGKPKETFFTTHIEDTTTERLHASSDDGKALTLVPIKYVPKYKNIVALMVGPVTATWLLVYSGIWIIRWIVRGFRKQGPD